jgi:hypothetical protein
MGGTKSQSCNELAKRIWNWCEKHNIWQSAAHVPGILNVVADTRSRKFKDQTEWMLNKIVFNKIISTFGTQQVDLFASRLNKQLPKYVAWLPDPGAVAIDAFTIDWGNIYFYAFPPFCLIGRCLQKVTQDNAEGILVVPYWSTQAWFPVLMRMLVAAPLHVHNNRQLLFQPVSMEQHPLSDHLQLLCCRISGNPMKRQDYLKTPWTSFRLL